VVVDPAAVRKPADADAFGSYELFVRAKMDMRVRGMLRGQLREAIVQARLAANGEDPARIRELTRVEAPEAREITRSGEQKASEMRQMMVPLAFMILLWVSVFAGGQMLLTSTIEEKSNRIMEVLLSAVSPMQLMTGKIVGQMAASLAILSLYALLGVSSLLALNRADLIEPMQIVYLIVFFFLAFFTIASMMAAVGSAVNDLQEANALLTPVMLVIMTPMILMMPIIFNPGGTLATVMSFTPPVNPFVMVLRLASSEPPPTWQVLVSIAIGVATVYVMLRLTAKIFRVGVLMYGKPPNLATLIKWVRMA
jgi:ABC-2 type transport system permease protein